MIGHVTGPGLACIYKLYFFIRFFYLCDKSYVGHVTGHVTWPMYISVVFSFGFLTLSLSFFFFLNLQF